MVEARLAFTAGGLAEPLAVPVEPTVGVATTGIPAVPPGEVVAPGADAGSGAGGDGSQDTVASDETTTTTTAAPASTTPPAGAGPGG